MAKVITTELQHSGASGANITLDSSKNVTCENNLQVDGNLTVTGTIPADKLTGTAAAINGSNITNLPAANLTGALPAISGATLTGVSSPAAGRRLNRNGAMQINQRGGQSPAHDASGRLAYEGFGGDGYYVQWASVDELDGTIDTVEDGPEGFTHSTKWTTGTAESAIATNEWAAFTCKIDAFEVRDRLKWGTANAEPLTVSFWVKSSLTGTFYMSFYSPRTSGSRSLSQTYTISSANTWEKKTVTFIADTAGNEMPNTSSEQAIMWAFASGSQFSSGGSTSAWQDYAHATWLGGNNRNDMITTAGATFYITGVQAEVGSTATDFEYLNYAKEMNWCNRYYIQYGPGGATKRMIFEGYVGHTSYSHCQTITFPTEMRIAPAITKAGSWSEDNVASLNFDWKSSKHADCRVIASSAGNVYSHTDSDSSLQFSAEL